LSYIENLSPKEKAIPLQIGDIVHQLLLKLIINELTPGDLEHLDELVTKLYPENSEEVSLDIAIQAGQLINGYLHKYEDDPLTFIPGETILETDIGCCILTGRVDAWARPQDGRLWRVEHKTTGKMDSFYLKGLKGGLQGAIYDFLTEKLFDEPLTGTIYNLLVKTQIPQYHRAYTKCNKFAIERMLKTVEGVVRDIERGDFYPSSLCFGYNKECDFKLLCEYDSPSTRESFYQIRKEVT
jgi:hypothetical protein